MARASFFGGSGTIARGTGDGQADPPPRAALVLMTLVAFGIGLTLPDVDQALGLGHRSALTHSLLPALLACTQRRWRGAACGLGGGTGLHLAADSFPNAMIGYATVKLPLAGSIGAGASYAWLALNAVAALVLALWLARRLYPPLVGIGIGLVALVAGAVYLWRTDGGWPVLAIAAMLAWLAWRRRGPRPPPAPGPP